MIYQGTTTYYNSDFSHFGVKGMKWGVRRFQNKDGSLTSKGKKRYSMKEYREDRNRFHSEEYQKHYKGTKAEKLFNEAYAIADKWDLDQDDGGGGKPGTPQSARDKYMRLQEQAGREYDKTFTKSVRDSIDTETTRRLTEKYGKTELRRLKRIENAEVTAGVGAGILITIGLPVVICKGSAAAGRAIGAGILKGAKAVNRIAKNRR